MRLIEFVNSTDAKEFVMILDCNYLKIKRNYLQTPDFLPDSSMTIVGETYQINGTANNAYCRSHRPIASSECYMNEPCEPPVCVEGNNFLNFYSFGTSILGLKMYMPGGDYAPKVFICENF
jgi:hypothetical protein